MVAFWVILILFNQYTDWWTVHLSIYYDHQECTHVLMFYMDRQYGVRSNKTQEDRPTTTIDHHDHKPRIRCR